ncbi:DUF983 domain-containing protein [Qipengyuania sp. RANM35]|uniref:DUF983 domain-containing protein n=1 Tax=Qipengyuania sp. RANM35 TaxID=3068635 RepID=UPI0034DB2995
MTETREQIAAYSLPTTIWAAILRGVRSRCPRCGDGKIFRKWLKPVDKCPHCSLDISGQRADDFPAYIAMFATGHLLAPVLILLAGDYDLSPLVVVAIIIPLAIAMMIALLQPAKGAVIALQWWNGMHGFRRERQPEVEDQAP